MNPALTDARWRKSSYSGTGGPGGGDCVELAYLSEGRLAIRDSKAPDSGNLITSLTQLLATADH